MSQPMTCADCDSLIKVTIEPYGAGKMAVFTCKNCGISYDTNIDQGNIPNTKERITMEKTINDIIREVEEEEGDDE